MSNEAKVGAFSLAGIVLFIAAIAAFNGLSLGFKSGYVISAGFHQAVGLTVKGNVCLSGVKVGEIESIKNEGGGVTVVMRIADSDIQIPKDAKVTIMSDGVLGSKFINILPGRNYDDGFLADGDYVIGEDEAGMDTVFADMGHTMQQVQELLGAMNEIMGNPKLKSSLISMTENLRDASKSMKNFMDTVDVTLANSQDDIQGLVHNLSMMTQSMQRTMGSVEQMVYGFTGDGQVAANLKQTVENLAVASARVERMAANMEGVVGDPAVAEDLRQTIHNAKDISERANKIMTNGIGGNLNITPAAELMYSGHDKHTKLNAGVDIGSDTFLRLGVEDIGEDNNVDAQLGLRQGNFAYRGGMVNGKAGLGVDAYAGDKWKFTTEAYDLNDVQLRFRAQYKIAEKSYLLGEMDHLNNDENRSAYFGVRQEF